VPFGPPPTVPPPKGGVTALLSGFTGAKPPQGQSPGGLGAKPHVGAPTAKGGWGVLSSPQGPNPKGGGT
jgi:hypothetical protein